MKSLIQLSLLISSFLLNSIVYAATTCTIGSTYTIKDADSVRFESDNPDTYIIKGNTMTFVAPGKVNITAYAKFGPHERVFRESLEIKSKSSTQKSYNNKQNHHVSPLLYTGTEYQVPPFILEKHTQMVLHFVNFNRQQNNIRPLKLSAKLCKLANNHAKKFSDTQTSSFPYNLTYVIKGGAPIPEAFTHSCVEDMDTIEKIFNPKYKEIGIGYYDDINCPHVYTWVLIFK